MAVKSKKTWNCLRRGLIYGGALCLIYFLKDLDIGFSMAALLSQNCKSQTFNLAYKAGPAAYDAYATTRLYEGCLLFIPDSTTTLYLENKTTKWRYKIETYNENQTPPEFFWLGPDQLSIKIKGEVINVSDTPYKIADVIIHYSKE